MSGILSAAAAYGDGGVTVSVTPPAAFAGGVTGGHVGSVTAIGAGGDGTYSWAWTVIEPDPDYALIITHPALATTDFSFSPSVAFGVTARATVRVTVTSGALTAHADVLVSFTNNKGA